MTVIVATEVDSTSFSPPLLSLSYHDDDDNDFPLRPPLQPSIREKFETGLRDKMMMTTVTKREEG
ncbi:hypothetical protein CsSME_00024859 [Camellia sinensis var. sinensis]